MRDKVVKKERESMKEGGGEVKKHKRNWEKDCTNSFMI